MNFAIILVALIIGSCFLTVLFARSTRLSQTGVGAEPTSSNFVSQDNIEELSTANAGVDTRNTTVQKYFPQQVPAELSFKGIVFGIDHNTDAANQCPTFDTYIAGVNRYITPDCVGGMAGYAFPEPTNPVDPEAVVLYDLDGNKVGYVPARHLANYKARMGEQILPWVGCTYHGSDVPLHSRITLIDPQGSRTAMQDAVTLCCNAIDANCGRRYVPRMKPRNPLLTA